MQVSIHARILALAAATAMGLPGCRDQAPPTGSARKVRLAATQSASAQPGRYIVVLAAEHVPTGFGDRVARLGGAGITSLDSIGVATVTGLTADAAAALATDPDVQAVEPDRILTLGVGGADPAGEELPAPADATGSPTGAKFYARQWNMRAIFAPEAWARGYVGSHDVVIALLDSGIDYTLADFAGLVDLDRSKSFTPEEDPVVAERFPGRLPISDLFSHGTAVASVIATNGTVLAGVSQKATLIAVKVFNRLNQGSVAQLLSGLVYAADQNVDVINMSLGDTFDKRQNPGIVAAVNRVANYAFRRGAVLVASADNDAADLDHDAELVVLPCEAAHVICVSATGPTSNSGVNGPWVDVDAFVSLYSNYGRSAVDVAAPGGTGDFADPQALPFGRIWTLCTTTPTEQSFGACRAGNAIAQPFGTSFSAAHVSGLASLLVAQLGHGNPALIRERILRSASDLGLRGVDPFYGAGRINVTRALGLMP